MLFVYGWLGQGYLVTAVAHDFAPYLVILAGVVLGLHSPGLADTDRLLVGCWPPGCW
jgi:hypothetical protein